VKELVSTLLLPAAECQASDSAVIHGETGEMSRSRNISIVWAVDFRAPHGARVQSGVIGSRPRPEQPPVSWKLWHAALLGRRSSIR